MDEQVGRYLALYQSVLMRKGIDPPSSLGVPETTEIRPDPSAAPHASRLDKMVS